MKKILLIISLIIVILIMSGFIWYQSAFAPTASTVPVSTVASPAEIRVLAENLSVPWDIAQLPDRSLLVTERTGDLLHIAPDGSIRRLTVPAISPAGEGGLMGIALHPDFVTNQYIYLYRTTVEANVRTNEVVRYTYHDDHSLSDQTIILSAIPSALYHDGGALAFGPDGFLYITTGDALTPDLAQDTRNIVGKLLRLTDAGEPAPGNPFGSLVYSYGHRNAQGLAWDSAGRLWSTEHGRSGVRSGFDEVNQITPGANYGWPQVEGDEVLAGATLPALHSGASETWAPASLAHYDSALYFAGLRGERLYRATITDAGSLTDLTAFFPEEYGRLRAVRVFGDTLYLTTSNTDGRGEPGPRDDRLIAIPLSLLDE